MASAHAEKGTTMVEFTMAWILLFIGFVKWEAAWFVASGVFAIAAQISRFHDYRERKDNG